MFFFLLVFYFFSISFLFWFFFLFFFFSFLLFFFFLDYTPITSVLREQKITSQKLKINLQVVLIIESESVDEWRAPRPLALRAIHRRHQSRPWFLAPLALRCETGGAPQSAIPGRIFNFFSEIYKKSGRQQPGF